MTLVNGFGFACDDFQFNPWFWKAEEKQKMSVGIQTSGWEKNNR